MLDVAVAYNKYKFLGYEFLTWLWFMIEKNQSALCDLKNEMIALEIGNRMVLENNQNDRNETITIKGDDAGLEEGMLAIKKGAMVTEINLVLREVDKKWQFNIKGESLNISSLKCPETGGVESKDDIEGAALEKIFLYETIINVLQKIYKNFITIRVSNEWESDIVPGIKKWIVESN